MNNRTERTTFANAGGPLRTRTKSFALRVIRMFSALPKTVPAETLGRQVLRSGTSVGAQYREACRARSSAEFISKIESVLQELDETCYWLELISESGLLAPELLGPLTHEANELTAMMVASVRTAKSSRRS
jgi:four helix bundle protein